MVEIYRNYLLFCSVNIFPIYLDFLLFAIHPLFQFLANLKYRQFLRRNLECLA